MLYVHSMVTGDPEVFCKPISSILVLRDTLESPAYADLVEEAQSVGGIPSSGSLFCCCTQIESLLTLAQLS